MENIKTGELMQHAQSVESKLIQIWTNILRNSEIGLSSPFFALGGSSLDAIQLSSTIEHEFAIDFPASKVFSLDTIRTQSKYISSKVGQQYPSFIYQLQQGTKKPLILLHPLGGSIFAFMPLIKGLEKDRPIIGIQDPFLSGNLHFYANIEEIAADYIKHLDLLHPYDELILAGYSLGGTIAFEMAKQLLAQNRKVSYLFIIDSWAQVPFDTTIRDQLQNIVTKQSERVQAFMESNFVLDKQHWHEIMVNRLEALLNYSATYAAVKLALITPKEILPAFKKNSYADNAWAPHVDTLLTLQINGNHENMLEEENVAPIRNFFKQILSTLQ